MKSLVSIGMILGLFTFFMAPYMAVEAAVLLAANSTPFNAFLAAWIDVVFYVLSVIFFSLALGSLDFR